MREKTNYRPQAANYKLRLFAIYRLLIVILILLVNTLYVFSQPADISIGPSGEISLSQYEQAYYSQVFGYKIPDEFNCKLYDEVSSWLGTPYCYAGKNEKGIDCSGFVNRIYSNVYGIPLTGNSSGLYQSSDHLKKNKLQEGDLVFFKIHRKRISHVGIYLGENKFAHSSRTNGVMVSDLDEPYYKKRFICGGKILDNSQLTTDN